MGQRIANASACSYTTEITPFCWDHLDIDAIPEFSCKPYNGSSHQDVNNGFNIFPCQVNPNNCIEGSNVPAPLAATSVAAERAAALLQYDEINTSIFDNTFTVYDVPADGHCLIHAI